MTTIATEPNLVMETQEEESAASFSEKTFFTGSGANKKVKTVSVVDCAQGVPESLPSDRILLLKNYKQKTMRGRKDALRGKAILVLPTPKGPLYLPFEDAKQFATYLYSFTVSVEKKTSAQVPGA